MSSGQPITFECSQRESRLPPSPVYEVICLLNKDLSPNHSNMETTRQSEEGRYQGPIRRRRSRPALPCQGVARSGKISILVSMKGKTNPLIIKHWAKKKKKKHGSCEGDYWAHVVWMYFIVLTEEMWGEE